MREDWQPKFLETLLETPNVSEACRAANISRVRAYAVKAEDPVFAQAWEDALESSTDDLAAECYRRARHGTEKPVFHMGQECGRIREYSDTLAIFLLKSHRPEVYREKVEQSQSGVATIRVEYADKPTQQLEYHPDSTEAPLGPDAHQVKDEPV
jgi:plasmid stabilization system protein ParE